MCRCCEHTVACMYAWLYACVCVCVCVVVCVCVCHPFSSCTASVHMYYTLVHTSAYVCCDTIVWHASTVGAECALCPFCPRSPLSHLHLHHTLTCSHTLTHAHTHTHMMCWQGGQLKPGKKGVALSADAVDALAAAAGDVSRCAAAAACTGCTPDPPPQQSHGFDEQQCIHLNDIRYI